MRILGLEKKNVLHKFPGSGTVAGSPTDMKITHLLHDKPKIGVVGLAVVKTAQVGDPL